jgi:hypothetical protein
MEKKLMVSHQHPILFKRGEEKKKSTEDIEMTH